MLGCTYLCNPVYINWENLIIYGGQKNEQVDYRSTYFAMYVY